MRLNRILPSLRPRCLPRSSNWHLSLKALLGAQICAIPDSRREFLTHRPLKLQWPRLRSPHNIPRAYPACALNQCGIESPAPGRCWQTSALLKRQSCRHGAAHATPSGRSRIAAFNLNFGGPRKPAMGEARLQALLQEGLAVAVKTRAMKIDDLSSW
jgi:hypothetical protein